MYIKLTKANNAGYLYLDFIPTNVAQYQNTFWYFSQGLFFSYQDSLPYRFKTKEDVAKIIDHMIECYSANCPFYDLDKQIKSLGIVLYEGGK